VRPAAVTSAVRGSMPHWQRLRYCICRGAGRGGGRRSDAREVSSRGRAGGPGPALREKRACWEPPRSSEAPWRRECPAPAGSAAALPRQHATHRGRLGGRSGILPPSAPRKPEATQTRPQRSARRHLRSRLSRCGRAGGRAAAAALGCAGCCGAAATRRREVD